jgi:SAM-dependent methyltransferase
VTLVDLDPALLALARTALPHIVTVLDADLDTPGWMTTVAAPTDVVLTVMTLHYFPPQRLQALYREIRTLLRPGGILFAVDDMPDPGLPALSRIFREEQPRHAGPHPTWTTWWQRWASIQR